MFNHLVIETLLHKFPAKSNDMPYHMMSFPLPVDIRPCPVLTSHPLKTVLTSRSIIFTVVAYKTLLPPQKQCTT